MNFFSDLEFFNQLQKNERSGNKNSGGRKYLADLSFFSIN